jgi:hypothetical protein
MTDTSVPRQSFELSDATLQGDVVATSKNKRVVGTAVALGLVLVLSVLGVAGTSSCADFPVTSCEVCKPCFESETEAACEIEECKPYASCMDGETAEDFAMKCLTHMVTNAQAENAAHNARFYSGSLEAPGFAVRPVFCQRSQRRIFTLYATTAFDGPATLLELCRGLLGKYNVRWCREQAALRIPCARRGAAPLACAWKLEVTWMRASDATTMSALHLHRLTNANVN